MIILYLCNFISTLKQTKRRLRRVTLISRFRRYRTVQLHRKFGLTDREATISSIQKNPEYLLRKKLPRSFRVMKNTIEARKISQEFGS